MFVISGRWFFDYDMFLPVGIVGLGIVGSVVDPTGFLTFAGRNHNKSGNN